MLAKHNVGFNLGYAYAVNDSVALSGVFIGTYGTDERAAGAVAVLTPARESYQL